MTSSESSPATAPAGALLWTPSAQRAGSSAMARFAAAAADLAGGVFDDYEALWGWSVDHPEQFWPLLAQFFGVQATGSWTPMRERDDFSGAGWFPRVTLNYAEQALAPATTSAGDEPPALVVLHEGTDPVEVSRAELRGQVGALAAQLRAWGVRPGDRVAAYLPNGAEAIVGLLASAAVGAIWACSAPDYGVDAVVDRLAQIEPTVLLATTGYRFAGEWVDRTGQASTIASRLPSLRHLVLADGQHDDAPVVTVPSAEVHAWREVVAEPAEPVFEPVAFDAPLWVLYSSGTTGLPKGIVHSHGGIVLEHLKWLGLHDDVGPGDRFFWFTSTAWMVWNAAAGALLTGATMVTYDGSPTWPDKDVLWDAVARTATTHFGTSAGFLTACQRAGLAPGARHDLTALRCVMSSGSPLPAPAWSWVYEHVKPDVWLDAPSGGTDVCTPYVGGNPLRPVRAGHMQSRFLGTRVEAWRDDATPVVDEVGELVVTAPMPTMPIQLWNDTDGSRYAETYFSTFPGVWRHGDWLTLTSQGSAVVHGRSDSTINRHGIRLGSADIYTAVETIPQIADALVIGAELDAGQYWMPLFVTLAPGAVLDDELRHRVATTIRDRCSPRHVPDEILEVPAIPHTLTGKRLEVPVKRLIQGFDPAKALNTGVVDRPDVIELFIELGRQRRAASTPTRHTAGATQ